MFHPFRKLLAMRPKESDLVRIRRAAGRLDVGRLVDDGAGWGEASLFQRSLDDGHPRLFGYYSAAGIDYALKEMDVYRRIEEKGFLEPKASITGDDWVQAIRIVGRAQGAEHLVFEGRFRRIDWMPPDDTRLPRMIDYPIKGVMIEWLFMQNPLAEFTVDRPRLPGQAHPGLGLRDEMMEVFFAVAARLDLDAYLVSAKWFHNAIIYSPMFFCVSPERQAMYLAIKTAGQGRSLQEQTLAVEAGCFYRDGRPCMWAGGLMICPISERVAAAFERTGFREEVERLVLEHDYRFDWERFEDERCRIHLRLLDDEPEQERLT